MYAVSIISVPPLGLRLENVTCPSYKSLVMSTVEKPAYILVFLSYILMCIFEYDKTKMLNKFDKNIHYTFVIVFQDLCFFLYFLILK
jgi:hypothetical protein